MGSDLNTAVSGCPHKDVQHAYVQSPVAVVVLDVHGMTLNRPVHIGARRQ